MLMQQSWLSASPHFIMSPAEKINPRPYLILLFLSATLGFICAVITFAFIKIVHIFSDVIWEQTAQAIGMSLPIFTIIVCTAGGLLVGVLVKLFGDHNGIFAELMAEFGHTGRFNYRSAPGIVLTSFVSLISGGSLGPEAPMADACGGVGTWVSEKLKLDDRSTRSLGFSGLSGMLGAFITSPFGGALLALESSKAGVSLAWTLIPSLIASAVATTVFALLAGAFFGHLYTFDGYTPRLVDLVLAVPLGLLGGLGLGIIGALLPLTLFSGEEQTLTVIQNAAAIGVGSLIIIAFLKLIVTSLLLATGWKGGYMFPTMFAGASLGMAAHLIFPDIPPAVAVAATMAGAMVATMKAPIFTTMFVLILVQSEAAPVIAIAVIMGLLASARLSMMPKPQAAVESAPAAQKQALQQS
jgi:H+/Cl- antiporter ClcA